MLPSASAKRKVPIDDNVADTVPAAATSVPSYPRKRIAIACELCRVRKTRCNGSKPSCSSCSKLEVDCIYERPSTDQPRERNDDLANALERLNTIELTLNALVNNANIQPRNPSIANTPASHHISSLLTSPSSVTTHVRTPHTSSRTPNFLVFKPGSGFTGGDSLSYDCTEDFFRDQLRVSSDLRNTKQALEANLDLSRPHLWRLQQSFAEYVLKWLPLFDHETAAAHIQAARLSGHGLRTPSMGLVFLIYAIGSLAGDTSLYTPVASELPGFPYYVRAREVMESSIHVSEDLCVLQSIVLAAIYLLYAMRPVDAWKMIYQASQNCILLLKAKAFPESSAQYGNFCRIYWICYVLDTELETCLELPPSGLRAYEDIVPLPSSHYEEEGMYYLLALSSLRKVMVEVVDTIGLKSPTATAYAPGVILELRSQIENWYQHLPSSLRVRSDHFLLFDVRRTYLRCQYHALVAVVSWPFIPRCQKILREREPGQLTTDDEFQNVLKGANECLNACREYLKTAEEILTQKSLVSHLTVRSYFTTAMILLLVFPASLSGFPDSVVVDDDRLLLEQALHNIANWNIVPFMRKPLSELKRIARLRGLKIS